MKKPFGAVATVTIAVLYALDQATKFAVTASIPFETGERPVIPGFFSLVDWGNTGAAFSSFSQKNGMFIGLSAVTLAVLAFCAFRGMFRQGWTRAAVCLLTAGVLGNCTDRILHGHVIDFLLFDLHVPYAHPWPAFNVADSCICVAAFLFIAGGWLEERKAKEAGNAGHTKS